MATVDITFRIGTWEGYDIQTITYPDEAKALEALAREFTGRKGLKEVHAIVVNHNPDKELSLTEVIANIDRVMHSEELPSSLYTGRNVQAGTHIFKAIDRSDEKEQNAWVVFEYRGKNYKWRGQKYNSGDINWENVNKLSVAVKEETQITIVSWK